MTEPEDPALLAAGYALGILSPEETAAYEAYLTSSEAARAEAAAHEATAATLRLDAPTVTPPPSLKADIMAKLDTTPQLAVTDDEDRAAVSMSTESADEPRPAATRRHAQAAEPTRAPGTAEVKAHGRWFSRAVGITAVAAAAVALFFIGSLVGAGIGNGHPNEQKQVAALTSISSAPDAQRATAKVAGGGTATLVWSDTLDKSALLVNELDSLPSDKTYQLWYIRGKDAVSAGTMNPSKDATTWRVLDGKLTAGDTIGLTVEPAGGSKQPTTQPLVAIPI